jgi:RNA polymerase sigma factor (sigma-70 family)
MKKTSFILWIPSAEKDSSPIPYFRLISWLTRRVRATPSLVMMKMSDPKARFDESGKSPGARAMAQLLEQHHDAILRMCRRVLRHTQDAEDACQEVLLEVYRQAGSLQDPAGFPGWLYRTALHTALDLRRKRGRERVRETRARATFVACNPSDDLNESLYAGLARLDDDSRALMVEHYLAERSLRDLAVERGCSRVSVWKRLRNVRKRLRSMIGSGAMAALEARGGAGVLGKFIGLGRVPGAVGVKLAVGVPLGLAVLVGVALFARSPEPTVSTNPTAAFAPLPRFSTPERPPLPAPGPIRPGPEEKPEQERPSAPGKPYPYKASILDAPSGAQWAWSILSTKRVTLDEQNVSLAEALAAITKQTGLKFIVDPDLAEEKVGFKVASLVVDGCLRLLLQPRRQDFEIRPDGQIHVGMTDRIEGGFERAAREAEAPVQELKIVTQYLDGGWSGVGDPNDWSPKITVALKRTLTLPQGESTLKKELARLEKTADIRVSVDLPTPNTVAELRAQEATMNAPFLQTVEERTIGAHLDQLAGRIGLVVAPITDESFEFTTSEKAAERRAKAEERSAAARSGLQILEQALPNGGRFTVQRFAEWVRSTHGVPVIPSEDAWNARTEFSIPPGATLRQGLDALKAGGWRWAFSDGKIFILK